MLGNLFSLVPWVACCIEVVLHKFLLATVRVNKYQDPLFFVSNIFYYYFNSLSKTIVSHDITKKYVQTEFLKEEKKKR